MNLYSQNAFSDGDNNINLGIGIGSNLGGRGFKSTLPPLSISYERCIIDELFDDKSSLGVGGYFGYSTSRSEFSSTVTSAKFGFNYSYLIIGARGALHYHLVDKLDTYGGLMLGLNITKHSTYGNWHDFHSLPLGNTLGWSLFFGGRYYFHENLAAFAELGYGIAFLQVGITFKF